MGPNRVAAEAPCGLTEIRDDRHGIRRFRIEVLEAQAVLVRYTEASVDPGDVIAIVVARATRHERADR